MASMKALTLGKLAAPMYEDVSVKNTTSDSALQPERKNEK